MNYGPDILLLPLTISDNAMTMLTMKMRSIKKKYRIQLNTKRENERANDRCHHKYKTIDKPQLDEMASVSGAHFQWD